MPSQKEKQDLTPIITMLKGYAQTDVAPFHMPGHKMGRGFCADFPLGEMARWDITEIPDADDLHNPQGVIAQSQTLTAKAYKAFRTFYLVQGATVGVHAMLMATLQEGDGVLLARNAHQSAIHACVLCGAKPYFVLPEPDDVLGVGCVTPQKVKAQLDIYPNIRAVLVSYPDYRGFCCDLPAIAKLVHEKGAVLLVDSAHGAHFAFSEKLPPDAGACGADLWVHSAHKTLPSLTQTAYLHTANGVFAERIAGVLRVLTTSSPSYLLMASLEYARAQIQANGAEKLDALLDRVSALRRNCNALAGIRLLGREMIGQAGIWDADATRLVLLCNNGFEVARSLREQYAIEPEMSDENSVVLIASVADTEKDFTRLREALRGVPRVEQAFKKRTQGIVSLPPMRRTPRQAMLGDKTAVALMESVGRICAQSVCVYPPGIPLVCPGEEMTQDILDFMVNAQNTGAKITGIFQGKVFVIRENL